MAKNQNLNDAAKAKKDEFYTQLEDIERELNHEDYQEFFKGKTVLCNCDDPYESEFFKYFAMNFNALQLKKLIVTCYAGSPVAQTELNFDTGGAIDKKHRNEYAYKVVITEFRDWNGDGREDLEDIKQYILSHRGSWEKLQGKGDFRSAECIEILKEADVVVTNPPFSLFREFVAQLMQYKKFFVILGNKNAITYKEIFPLIMQNKMFVGYTPMSKDILFTFPEKYKNDFIDNSDEGSRYRIVEGRVLARAAAIWYTNIPLKKYTEELPLVCSYYENPELYPKYDNYDAIEVSKTARIPYDYLPDRDLTNSDEKQHTFSDVRCQMSDVRCQMSDIRCQMSDATESWGCQSHSSTSTTQINSRLSVAPTSTETPKCISPEQPGIQYSTARKFTSDSSSGGKCNGVMGVPITFLDKYNPNQFEIFGLDRYVQDNPNPGHRFTINNHEIYARILIRRKL